MERQRLSRVRATFAVRNDYVTRVARLVRSKWIWVRFRECWKEGKWDNVRAGTHGLVGSNKEPTRALVIFEFFDAPLFVRERFWVPRSRGRAA
jgi:hypothetical protein